MRYAVTQDFVTPLHRFRAGAEIDGADVDGSLTAEEWVALGCLQPIPEVPAEEEPELPAVEELPPEPEPTPADLYPSF